mmetsp:Transcript_89639/g.182824  ORF Transcript_89639/g.182824 Transcript_89639/m.182824 type:complete len:105 (-) Transcript_89639:104-418(-)
MRKHKFGSGIGTGRDFAKAKTITSMQRMQCETVLDETVVSYCCQRNKPKETQPIDHPSRYRKSFPDPGRERLTACLLFAPRWFSIGGALKPQVHHPRAFVGYKP